MLNKSACLSILIFIATTSFSQTDTLAPYQKTSYMPQFTIQTPDSSWFSKIHLKENKPTLILYFSPECGHCQMETEELLSKMSELKKLQVVMVTSKPFEDMVNFYNYYKLNRFPAIKIGSDYAKMVTQFYDVQSTPFSALYDDKGRLMKVYKKGIVMEELIQLSNNH